MATIKKPTRTSTKSKPAPARNLKQPESWDIKLLQFQVSPEMHKEFKAYAAMHGMTMLALFIDAYRFYKDKH